MTPVQIGRKLSPLTMNRGGSREGALGAEAPPYKFPWISKSEPET